MDAAAAMNNSARPADQRGTHANAVNPAHPHTMLKIETMFGRMPARARIDARRLAHRA